MPREIAHHDRVIEAIRASGLISELLDTHGNHYKYELELELIVYGRPYAEKRVGPYARLFVYGPGETIIQQGAWGGNTFFILIDGRLDVFVKDDEGVSQKVGEIEGQTSFGEMSVFAGEPRNATVVVPSGTEATVLAIQRPALRLLKKLKDFGERLEHNYRQHGLDHTLFEIQDVTNNVFSPQTLEKLKAAARFSIYPKDHALFQEGDPIDKLIFINRGWVRRVRGISSNPKSARSLSSTRMFGDLVMELKDVGLDFLGGGNWLGLEALTHDHASWNYGATVMSRTEALELSVSDVCADPELVTVIQAHFPQFSTADDNPPEPLTDKRVIAAAAKEISTGLVDATNLLVMDMDLCIRCGNCSLACHKVHGQSRLLRHGIHISRPLKPGGKSIQHVLSPAVCLHCKDPECLTGCPTGAIARFAQGQIDINPDTCIGCSDCATQCPYNAISMVPRKPAVGAKLGLKGTLRSWLSLSPPVVPPPVTETTDLLAV